MIAESEIIIRLAKRVDAVPISIMLKNLGLNFPDENLITKIEDSWDRLWDHNPYYEHFQEDVFYGWVMVHKGVIVGFFGSIPRVYMLNSKIIPVSIGSQWGVVKEYRQYTNLLCNKYFNENPIPLKLATTAIKPSGRIFEKYHGSEIPTPELITVTMIPINLGKLVRHKYNKLISSNVIFSFLFKVIFSMIPWKVQFYSMKKNHNFTEVKANNLPKDINEFFDKTLLKISGLVALRNSSIVEWLHTGGTRGLKKSIFVYRENEKTRGYASLVDEPVKENSDIKRYKIIDLLADNQEITMEILKELIRYSYEMHADVLEIHQPGMIDTNDIPFIKLKRELPQFPLYYHSSDETLSELLKLKSSWHIMPFDGDTCLG